MSVACLLITDGRPCLQETLASAEEFLFPYLDGPTVLVSDSQHKLGLSGAIRTGWDRMQTLSRDISHVFHLEDDFTFREPVPIDDMLKVLNRERLEQVALRRDFVPGAEPPGGYFELHPDRYRQNIGWVESSFGFTFNPCLYPMRVATQFRMCGWQGEAGLTTDIRHHYRLSPSPPRFGIYGNLTDPPRCFHIGHQRSAGWKL